MNKNRENYNNYKLNKSYNIYHFFIMKTLLGITIDDDSKEKVLEKILKYWEKPIGFFHIVSLNPENVVIAQTDLIYKTVLNDGNIRLNDGFGIAIASRWLKINIGVRLTGVDLMKELVETAGKSRFHVLLIGGEANLAESLAKCYQEKWPEAKFIGIQGIKNISSVYDEENKKIFSIVAELKPSLILVAFGSPFQEKWLWQNKQSLGDCVAMGVGQGFDVEGRRVKRAPVWIQKIGMEWFYRLLTQPWRWRRQLRLINFIYLVVKQKMFG